MKKLEKVSQNKKPKILVLYGAIAVGKLTVGKVLEKQLGYKLTHNHLINDLVSSVFDRDLDRYMRNFLIEKLRYEFYETCVKNEKNIIITHCYAHDYVSVTGLSDPKYMRELERRLSKNGAQVLFVHLQAENKELHKRIVEPSRKEFKKLTNVATFKKLEGNRDWITSPKVKNNFVIDNTNLSPKKVAKMIQEHFEL